MANAFEVLRERGFIYQTTDEENLRRVLGDESITFYIGYDPSASSLHVGNLLTIMAAAQMQRVGHRPIIIVGGGTGMVGDPSGKTEMRKMLTAEDIEANVAGIRRQLERYLDFGENGARIVNNADWLTEVGYIEFLRDVGVHFSVNKMLTSESVKQRLEKGLSFIEFNYVLLQAYDFYVLRRDYDCALQMGGQDQWGNIVAGIDLIRRMLSKEAYGITFPLITDSKGEKFGKSVAGAIWLDAEGLSPYEYYQFWRNTDDADVAKLLGFFTFLPMDEVKRLGALESPLINRAKEILAYEATAITHGEEEAQKAFLQSVASFGAADPEGAIDTSSEIKGVQIVEKEIPTIILQKNDLKEGWRVPNLYQAAGLTSTTSEARRLIKGGGCYIDGQRVDSVDKTITEEDVKDGSIELRVGKKKYKKVKFE